jgi:hypothetical protein
MGRPSFVRGDPAQLGGETGLPNNPAAFRMGLRQVGLGVAAGRVDQQRWLRAHNLYCLRKAASR